MAVLDFTAKHSQKTEAQLLTQFGEGANMAASAAKQLAQARGDVGWLQIAKMFQEIASRARQLESAPSKVIS